MEKGKKQSILRHFRPFSLLLCVFFDFKFGATSDGKGPGSDAEFRAKRCGAVDWAPLKQADSASFSGT